MTTTSSYSVSTFSENYVDKLRKLLMFQMGKLNLALPVESVKKIIHYTPMQGSGTTPVGIIHIDNQEITSIDLHKRLFKVSRKNQSESRQFMIIAKDSTDELFALVVGETPSLVNIPISQIRVLPDSYRRGDTLDVASHVIMIKQEDQSLTVFILDVDRLVTPIGVGDFIS
ncbi:chemotaxis protein CheW [Aphanothece sacrum]|uniref:Chemotaxis protein CheW n=1 Tax=Aphanothece sacrum FPU1 TaxID=1920663 RepID=A0A401IL52_APHSA|nr:chemotaxis protein CheW [Aphanothece sacrum]GBF81980.1 chemotaxis protein CheW [Aphanothece sacrum FPU1]GBF83610.1 chemotaxis protein CheW [Aphanothece sacrum FPU3]